MNLYLTIGVIIGTGLVFSYFFVLERVIHNLITFIIYGTTKPDNRIEGNS